MGIFKERIFCSYVVSFYFTGVSALIYVFIILKLQPSLSYSYLALFHLEHLSKRLGFDHDFITVSRIFWNLIEKWKLKLKIQRKRCIKCNIKIEIKVH
mgnify:CR=1 FL=1